MPISSSSLTPTELCSASSTSAGSRCRDTLHFAGYRPDQQDCGDDAAGRAREAMRRADLMCPAASVSRMPVAWVTCSAERLRCRVIRRVLAEAVLA